MISRDEWTAGVNLLKQYLHDDLALAKAMKAGRWADLAAAAKIANDWTDNRLAITDPALYRTLRDSITRYHLRGYGSLDVAILLEKAGRSFEAKASNHSPEGAPENAPKGQGGEEK